MESSGGSRLFRPEGIFLKIDCSGKFLRYFARLYISLCLYVIEHSFVFLKSKLAHIAIKLWTHSGGLLEDFI